LSFAVAPAAARHLDYTDMWVTASHCDHHCGGLPMNAKGLFDTIRSKVNRDDLTRSVLMILLWISEHGEPAFCAAFKPYFEEWGMPEQPSPDLGGHLTPAPVPDSNGTRTFEQRQQDELGQRSQKEERLSHVIKDKFFDDYEAAADESMAVRGSSA
jgi:hypothetical protein